MAPLILTCGTATDFSAAIPPLLVSPLIGATADYSAIFPPPLVSPLIGVAADYSAIFPPLVSPLISSAADYFDIFPPPLVSPRIGSATDYSATFPPPLVSPLSGSAADYPALIPPHLIPLPTSALQLFPPPHGDLSRPPLPPSQSGSVAIPTSPSAPTSSSSDPYADGLRVAIAETERLVATAQATATAAPENGAARDLARILTESLESTRKRLTEHLAAPSPRSASTPLSCSHICYAKDLLGYLTERFQSQTPISVIALLRELISVRLADFTTMADYIARVQTLSSQLSTQQFELSDHVCGALLLTGLTPEYSVHVALYADALSLPHTLEFVLDSGATGSVFRDAGVLRSFPHPSPLKGLGIP
ncbi:unnamed protein product [Closterium sp. NIES-65]|nr:unnamed protein product [Closterium sp. NIES-65]